MGLTGRHHKKLAMAVSVIDMVLIFSRGQRRFGVRRRVLVPIPASSLYLLAYDVSSDLKEAGASAICITHNDREKAMSCPNARYRRTLDENPPHPDGDRAYRFDGRR